MLGADLFDNYADLLVALTESGERAWRYSAYYGDDLTRFDIPWDASGSHNWNGDSQVQQTGTVHLGNSGDDNLVPTTLTDPLAPAGQELLVEYIVRGGGQEWAIPCGVLPIADVPDMVEKHRRAAAADLVLGYTVELALRDRFDVIRAAEFLQPEAPIAGNTTWGEIRRLSPFPIEPTLGDAALPAALTYGNSRLDAITTLMRNLGGVPHLTRQGTLTARAADPWLTETVPVFALDGVIDMSNSMSNRLYNAVSVSATVGDSTILAVAQITDPTHPLWVGGPFGTRTYRYSSPLIDTQPKADAAAATILSRVSTQHAKTVDVLTLPNPLLELGDYGTATDHETGRTVHGEIVSMRMGGDPRAAMSVGLRVAEVFA